MVDQTGVEARDDYYAEILKNGVNELMRKVILYPPNAARRRFRTQH